MSSFSFLVLAELWREALSHPASRPQTPPGLPWGTAHCCLPAPLARKPEPSPRDIVSLPFLLYFGSKFVLLVQAQRHLIHQVQLRPIRPFELIALIVQRTSLIKTDVRADLFQLPQYPFERLFQN